MRCPQGSCLSPLLYLFFINDLPNASKSFSLGIVYFISPAHLERCSSWDVVQWSHPIPSVRPTYSNWYQLKVMKVIAFVKILAFFLSSKDSTFHCEGAEKWIFMPISKLPAGKTKMAQSLLIVVLCSKCVRHNGQFLFFSPDHGM